MMGDISPLVCLGAAVLGVGSVLVYALAPAAGSGVFVSITCHCSRPDCAGRRLVPVNRLVAYQGSERRAGA
jgi:hypothetical protein